MSKEKEPKVKVISDLVAAIAKLALNFAENQVEKKVQSDIAEKGILLFLPATRNVIEVLNDTNPANADQVKEVLLKWINEDLASFVEELGLHLTDQAENDNQKNVALFSIKVATHLLRIYSDNDKDNKAQVSEFLQSMIDNPTFRELLMDAIIAPVLRKAKAGEEFITLIGKALEYSLDTIEVKK